MPIVKLDRKAVKTLTLPTGKSGEVYWDTELKGFGLRLRLNHRKDRLLKSFLIQYRIAGVQRVFKVGDENTLNANQARNKARELLAKVTLGTDPAGEKKAAATSKITFKTAVDQYLQAKERQVVVDKRRPATLKIARLYLQKGDYFRPLHNRPLDSIKRADIAQALNGIVVGHSENTARQSRRFLSAFLTWTMRQGLTDIEANPVEMAPNFEGNPPRQRVLKDHELREIWNACEDAGEFGVVVKLLMLSGLRRSEIGKLRWSWLDLEHENTMTIPAAVAKNHEQHVLPLVGMMRSIIASIPQRVSRDPLFGERAEGFTKWHSRLDVTLEPWTLHDLRRTFSTGMHNLGVEPHIVEAILNHTSGHKAGVAGRYNYARYPNQMKQALALWSDHVASITSGSGRKILPLRRP